MGTETKAGLRRTGNLLTGEVFRFPGHVHYWIKTDAPTAGDSIQAVCLNTLDNSGNVETFAGDLDVIVGPMGLPTDCLLPLGF